MDKVEMEGLTEEETSFIADSLSHLAVKENQIAVVTQLLELCPDLVETMSNMPDVAIQSAFLMNMYKRGMNLMCAQNHQEVFEIFERHPKYKIKVVHVEKANECVLNVLKSCLCEEELIAWQKLQDKFLILMRAAYDKQLAQPQVSSAKLAKYRKRVFRSMTGKDIDDVTAAFAIIAESREESAILLARLLATETRILKVFHAHSIDVASQADVIFSMIEKVIVQLTDVDNLIPWLRGLGTMHAEMEIMPRTLTLMKPILIKLFEQSLGFKFTSELRDSWVRVVSFVIGMMMDGCRHSGNRASQASSVYEGTMDGDGNLIVSDAEIAIVQSSWSKVQKVLDVAVTSFYKDLIGSTAEVRKLFSKTDLTQQANKLVRAIGSTVALLSDLSELEPILEELGRRHVYYNVLPRHFKYLKLAWFNMLKHALALGWTDEVQEAWNKVWRYMTTIMKTSLEDALLLYTPPDPDKVKLKILINHVDRIETQNMTYWADIWYAAYTNADPSQSAAFGAEAMNDEVKHATGCYAERPSWNLTCLNGMEVEQIYREGDEVWCKKSICNGKNEWYTRGNIRGTFSHPFQLHAFPFDTHTIRLKFALQIDESLATFDDESLNVRLMPFKLDMMGGTDWDVFTPQISINRESAIKGGSASGKRYTHCVVDIPIARRWKHHIWDTFMPLMLIELFAFSVYFCAAHPLAKRLGVIATLLLTLFTFKITISEAMPPTPYATLIDYFFHVAKLLLVLHVLAQIALIQLESKVQHIDDICFATTAAVFLIANGILCRKITKLLQKYPKKEDVSHALTQISKTAIMSMKQSINTSMNISTNTSMNMD
eukprot:162082_1